MPQLAQEGKSEKFYLPSTNALPEPERAWVIIKTGKILGGDMLSIMHLEDKDQAFKALITERIEEWNFSEEDGKLSPITPVNVARMEPEDVKFLIEKLDFADEVTLTTNQKKSSSTTLDSA